MSSAVRIALLPNGPFEVNITASGEVMVSGGFEAGLLDALTSGLQLPYTLKVPEDVVWGIPDTVGNWSGIIGMVQREEADIALGSIFVSAARMSVVTLSHPYTWQDITFATRMPGLRPKATTLTWPFAYQVWILLAAFMTALTLVFRIGLSKAYPVQNITLHVLGILLRQAIGIKCRTFPDRLLVLSWMGGCFFLSYGYTAVLLSFLTLPLKERPLETVLQLSRAVLEGRYECTTAAGSSVVESLLHSQSKSAKTIGYHIWKQNKYLDLQDEEAVSEYLSRGNTAFLVTRERMKFGFQDQFYISRDALYSAPLAIAMSNRFRYKRRLNKVVQKISAAGLYQKAIGDYLHKKKLTSKYPERSKLDATKRLALDDLYGVFVLLVSGHGFSILVCAAELLYSNHTNYRSHS